MRLITSRYAFFYPDLDEHVYSCEGGASVTTFVRRQKMDLLARAVSYSLRRAPPSMANQ
jgi:hypothetical protein